MYQSVYMCQGNRKGYFEFVETKTCDYHTVFEVTIHGYHNFVLAAAMDFYKYEGRRKVPAREPWGNHVSKMWPS